jgi:hypothetical protein
MDRVFRSLLPEYPFQCTEEAERAYVLEAALNSATSRSVLTQLAIQERADQIYVTPPHGCALHSVRTTDDAAVLIRPVRINRRYWSTFESTLERLQRLLNEPRVRERDIENLLSRNPLLLGSLGYGDRYYQVVLPREGASALRPDVIAEPAGSKLAEIVELKPQASRFSLVAQIERDSAPA